VLVGGARLKSCRVTAARALYSCGLAGLLLLFGARVLQNAVAEGDTRTITLHHIHTDEDITITFKRDGRYDEAALEKLNWFLRDWRREQETRMDPHLIDLIWEVQREAGSKEPVRVVCGYRSPETNAMLRRRSGGVARFSQHMLGHAMDFYIPGVPLEALRVIGLRLQRGGVGFYPSSGSPFVHMDTGGVRMWPRMTREQLVRVFPDGRTVHIPSDGRPLPGYALALADLRAHGGTPSELLLEQARNAGVQVADASVASHRANPIAKFLGLTHDDEDEDVGAPMPAATAANAPPAAAAPLRTRAKAAVVAAIDRAEDKLAAEKVTLVKVASKVHVISRAEAAPLAALTPNQIILARGYWQGLPDGTTAREAQASANPLAAVSRPSDVASAAPEATASIGPFAAPHDDRAPADLALAYAEQAARDAAAPVTAAATVTSAPLPRIASARIIPVQTGDNETTIAVKRISGRPVSAIITVANKKLATPLADATRLDDPWLRALVMSPSVSGTISITSLGARDFRTLAALMVQPDSSVMMTFTAEPNPGLAADRFSGIPIVFVSTVTYPLHTAGLQ
jgi:uncharacterized protein YcbK (DUF882 family)